MNIAQRKLIDRLTSGLKKCHKWIINIMWLKNNVRNRVSADFLSHSVINSNITKMVINDLTLLKITK